MKNFLKQHSRQFLILDYNHLFVSSSLREEIWLLRRQNDTTLLSRVLDDARAFGIREIAADRALATYSGGEQALLACLLFMAFVKERRLSGVRLLLINVLESISSANRIELLKMFTGLSSTHELKIFCARGRQIEELDDPHEG